MIVRHVFPQTAGINAVGHLEVGGCDVVDLAAQYGTPLYVFDECTLRTVCRRYSNVFRSRYKGKVAFYYACKCLLNRSLAQLLLEEGFGFDAVSIDEIRTVLNAGARPQDIHFHGNAKPLRELREALSYGVGRIVVDNLDELELLIRLVNGRSTPQGLLLRLEPSLEVVTHPSIQTGQPGSKFGLPLDQLDTFARLLMDVPGLELKGLHFHLGSQLFDLAQYQNAITVILDAAVRLRDRYGMVMEELSPGGGLAAAYVEDDQAPEVEALAQQICCAVENGCGQRKFALPRLVLEPGRSISARAGIAVYEIIGSKPLGATDKRSATRYIHVDGGMGDNPRPAMYGAQYTALVANNANAPATEIVHISGRYCESGDLLVRNAELPRTKPGDLIVMGAAGAYTLSLSSNYNMVPRPAVLLVKEGQTRLVQRRESFEDLIGCDVFSTASDDRRRPH
jgi:diaminopimelate decarboxylase